MKNLDTKNQYNKIIKKSFMIIFLWYITYNLPSLVHTFYEKNKIQQNTEYSAKEIQKILHLMTYDNDTHVLLWTWENEIDIQHVYWMKNSTYWVLENLLLAEKKHCKIIKIKAGKAHWISYNIQWERIIHKTKIICSHSHSIIQWIAQNLWISQEEAYSLISALINLSLWEYIEKGQSQDLFVKIMTKSWYNQNDLNANITWILDWLAMHENMAYHFTPERFSQIIIKLQGEYGIWDATYYLEKLQKDHNLHIIVEHSVTK